MNLRDCITILVAFRSPASFVQQEVLRGLRSYITQHGLDWLTRSGPSAVLQAKRGEEVPTATLMDREHICWPEEPGSKKPYAIWCSDPEKCPPEATSVWFDDDAIGQSAARYVCEQGFRHAACLLKGKPFAQNHYRNKREQSFLTTCEARGIETITYNEPSGTQRTVTSIHNWLRSLPKRTALFSYESATAGHLWNDVNDLDLKPGERLGLISVGSEVQWHGLPITHIRLSWFQIGKEAGRAIHRVISGDSVNPIRIPPLGVQEHSSTSGMQDPWLERLTSHVHRNPKKTWRVGDVASDLGISKMTLTRKLRKLTGCTPGEWLRTKHLELAESALINQGSINIKDLASDLGWCHAAHFSHDFKRQYRMTATAFRRQNTESY